MGDEMAGKHLEPQPDFDLSEQSAAVGRVFDAIGEDLANCYQGISQVVDNAAQIREELCDETLERTIAKIDPILAHCEGLLSDFELDDILLAELDQAVARTQVPFGDLLKTVKMVEMVSINARVVTASIATTEDLGVFTNDLVELVSEMKRVISRFADLSGTLAAKVQDDRAQQRQFMEVQGKLLRRTITTLPADLGQIGRLEAEANRVQQAVATGAAAVQQSVARAVPLLQVGDSTRQRLEHVTQIPDRIDHSIRDCATVVHLRGELLDAAIAQLQTDARQMDEELENIGRSIAQIVQQVEGGEPQGQSADVETLRHAIGDTIALLEDCKTGRIKSASLRDASRVSLDELSACLSDLDNIAMAAGWVSLNAAISCVRLGAEGAALSLVAEQVRELNREITQHSGRIVELITDGKDRFDRVGESRAGDASVFAEFREHFSYTLDRVVEATSRAESLRSSLLTTAAAISDRLKVVQQHAGEIPPIVEELVSRAACQRPACDDEGGVYIESFTSARALLTMQSERLIFDAVLSSLADEQAAYSEDIEQTIATTG